MKKIQLLLVVAASLLLFSCGSEASQNDATNQEATEIAQEEEHEIDGHDSEPIELNNGELWPVNEEMRPFLIRGEEQLANFINSGSTDYQDLADKLARENASLIKSCTMEGKSHDELHKWLHPHLELTDALKKADSNETAAKLVSELSASYETYHQFFK